MLKLVKQLNDLYLSPRFFAGLIAVCALYILSYAFQLGATGLSVCTGIAVLWFVTLLADLALLFLRKYEISGERFLPETLSLGDKYTVRFKLKSSYNMALDVLFIDELPEQLEKRDFAMHFSLKPNGTKDIRYEILPNTRGEYSFGVGNVLVSLKKPGFVRRRFRVAAHQTVKIYPSIIRMKEYELMAFAKISSYSGLKKLRRIGHSYEFEQIRTYVEGDDYRSINWKATGRAGAFMVNQFEDERAQPVYCVIDTSRNMKMPFNGLSLLDHAVNSALVISNIALKKGDRSGLLTYSDKEGSFLKAANGITQLRKIITNLYNTEQSRYESDYDRLYYQISKRIVTRSLLFLYLNFESVYSLQRVLPILKKINRKHLLIVVFFENSEIVEFARIKPVNLKEMYDQVIAEKFIYEKQLIARELHSAKIQCILTRPEDLSLNTVNKYLELKARGFI